MRAYERENKAIHYWDLMDGYERPYIDGASGAGATYTIEASGVPLKGKGIVIVSGNVKLTQGGNLKLTVEATVMARQGKGIREIAREMGVSRNTVRRYLRDPSRASA